MGKKKEKQSLRRVFLNNLLMLKYIAKFTPGLLLWALFSAVLGGTVGVLDTVYVAKYVLDGLQNRRSFSEMLPFFLTVMLLNVLLALLNGLYQGSYFPRKKEYLYGKMHEELFEKARNMELACYDNPKFYNDFVWAMSEADEKAVSVLEMCSAFLKNLTALGGTLAIVASINAVGLFVAAFGLLLEFFVQQKLNKLDYDLSVRQRPLQRKRDYTSRILYQPEYAKEIRLTPVQGVLVDNFCESNASLIGEIRKIGIKKALYWTLSSGICYSALLYGFYMGYLLYGTLVQHIYTYGSFYALFTGTQRFSENWSDMIHFFTRMQKDSLYIEKFRNFIEYEPKMADKEGAVSVPTVSEAISLEHVSFTYEGMEEPTLKDINLTIHPGEKIALVGYNGAGKTTLIKLLMRLYEVSDGRISLGGKDIRDYKLEEFRKYFGVVFQDYQLLAATIAENVKMDCVEPSSDEAVIRNALEKSGFREKLEELAKGTETMVSREFDEKGVQLSGGEGQKVAIARVFPRDCKMVILDEPSSALDPISEYNVNQSMLAAAQDKTVLFISHRLSTTKLADRIIMLENGRIIEEGSHEELMKLAGRYAEMFNMQAERYK